MHHTVPLDLPLPPVGVNASINFTNHTPTAYTTILPLKLPNKLY